jgi:hypothetical protein
MSDFAVPPPPVSPPIVSSSVRRIKRIAPLQLGKMMGLVYGLLGLLFLPVFFLFSVIGSQLPGPQRVGMMAMGVGFALFMPVLYAVMGFVFGIIGAAIYNLIAKWVGGIEVEVD